MPWIKKPRSTGLLDISGDLLNGWTGTLFVEREQQNVFFRGNLDGSVATSDVAWVLPTGFRPGFLLSGTRYDYGAGIAWTSQTPPQLYRINHYLNRFQITAANGGASPININHSLRTRDAWPTTMPGVRI